MEPPDIEADTRPPPRSRPTYHRASSQRSAALARDILRRLKSIEDPDLEAPREREPERKAAAAPFSKRACATRLRSFATSRRLPTDDGAPPDLLARMGFELVATDVVTILKCVACGQSEEALGDFTYCACKLVVYCGSECQAGHRKVHKRACKNALKKKGKKGKKKGRR